MSTFQAVILGGDIGAYALARELNEAYDIKPLLVTSFIPSVIQDSRIVHRVFIPESHEEKPVIEALLGLGQRLKEQEPDRRLLLLANTDWRVSILARHRSELERYFILSIPSLETIEQVGDKQVFEQLATAKGMRVPRSFYADFSSLDDRPATAPATARPTQANQTDPAQIERPDQSDRLDDQPTDRAGQAQADPADQPRSDQSDRLAALLPPDDFPYPLVAKPATSAEYETLEFPGRQKVYLIQDRAELLDLWHRLWQAGFYGTFIAQELVRGDDTAMFSLTAYVDSTGAVSLLSSAQVLLEEHHPVTLGNPCAMITQPFPELFEQVKCFFEGLDYQGFANFDVKRDAQTGQFYFFEVNPRIGRNSFYVRGAGLNPMRFLVSDLVEGRPLAPAVTPGEVLYTIVPKRLLLKYVAEPSLRERVKRLYRQGKVVNPTLNPRDRSLRRQTYQYLAMLRQYGKFHTYYPKATDSGF